MAESASEVRTLMPCPLCGQSLIPASVDFSITFHCKSGHELALGELLRAHSAALKGGLELLLAAWNREYLALVQMAEDAGRNGFVDVAEIFDRHAKSLESRIDKVRSACMHSDTSKSIPLQHVLRTA
jgi:hypothetical protein